MWLTSTACRKLGYLTHRTQWTNINDTKSHISPLICDVPQGSTLGPLGLLFLHYVKDLYLLLILA